MIGIWKNLFGNISYRAWRVWQRDLDVYRTTWKTNFLPPILEPILYVLAFGMGMGSLIGTVQYQGQELPYLRFMFPGVIAVTIMFWSYFETTYSTFVRMYFQRTFEAIVATPLLAEDVIAGEWLWGATKALLASAVMLIMMMLMQLASLPEGLLVLPVAALGGLFFSAVGLITTAITPKIENFNVPMFIVIFPMFLFSATFFPIDVLPQWAMVVAMALPLTHVSSLVRGACLGMAPPFWIWSVVYLVLATLIVTGIAIVTMRRRLLN